MATFPVRFQVCTGERLLLLDLRCRQVRLLKGGEQLNGVLQQWKRMGRVVFPDSGIRVNLSVLRDRYRKGVIVAWKREDGNPEEEMIL